MCLGFQNKSLFLFFLDDCKSDFHISNRTKPVEKGLLAYFKVILKNISPFLYKKSLQKEDPKC